MKPIQIILTLVFFLMATALPAENINTRAIMAQSEQRLSDKRETLGVNENHTFQARQLTQDGLGQTHIRFQQFYNGVRIWGGEIITHTERTGKELAPSISALKQNIQVDTKPKLSVADTLAVIKKDLNTRAEFAYQPNIELVIYPNTERQVRANRALTTQKPLNAEDFVTTVKGYELAYYVHTELEQPNDTRHTDYLINAHTGAIIEKWDSLMTENIIGTGKSQYSGTVNLNTNSVAGGFELRDLTRPLSGGNVIYNLDHATEGQGRIYTNNTNTWGDGANFKEDPEPTTSINGQTAAVDAAFGIQATWDMYKNVFGRSGINGEGKATYARVHYDYAYDNAFYSDQCMCITYGDGTKLQTLTSLDVAAHEFAHGVCMTTAGLIYNKESGGLNEANSDIMGAMAEFYSRGANGKGNVIPDTGGNWTQGEQLTTPAYPLKMRFLYKPSKDGKSADAWSPTLQNLNVHYSSGPMNRAFYFLSQGVTKTGETSSTYLPQGMTGIGNDKAAKIWFRALTTYMTPATDYAGARIACIQAVRDLFQIASPEEIAVWNAFAAINVGSSWSGIDMPPTVSVSETGDKGLLTFNATASDDKGVVKVEFLLDDVLVGSSTIAPYTMTYDSTLQDDGNHKLVAKAIDTTGQYTNASMTFAINNGQLVRNGSFEKGYGVGWSNTTGMQIGTILNQTAYDGTKMAKFCGTGSKMSVALYQSLTIPASANSATLSYALHIETKDSSSSVASDTFVVQIRNSSGTVLQTLANYSNLNAAAGYKVYSFDVSAYKGQTIQLYFLGAEDGALSTGFILDKVNLIISGTSNGSDPILPTVTASASGHSGMITFSATASDNVGVTKVEFYLDNNTTPIGSDETAPYSMSLDSKTLSNGNHQLVAKAFDAAGNIGISNPVSFSVNNPSDAPAISVNVTGSSGMINFNATTTSSTAVAKVEFYVEQVLKGTDDTAPYSMTFDSLTLPDGNYSLIGKVYDATGKIGISANVIFNIKNAVSSATYNEVESNNNAKIANVVADTVTKIVGYIGAANDVDYFKINIPAGRTLTVNMTGPAKDYDLYLLSSTGNILKTSADPGATESVTYKNSSTTTASYYLKISNFGGAYSLSTPYTLSLTR